MRSLTRAVIYGLLMLEAVNSAFWIERLLPSLAVRDRTTIVLVCLRALVSGLQGVGGLLLRANRMSGPAMARGALWGSAALIPFEVGARLVPGNLDPTYRWWVVVAYWIYAATATWYLSSARS